MGEMMARWAVGAMALAVLAGSGAAKADAITDWMGVLDEVTGASFKFDTGRTVLSTRVDGRMALAMFEAADAVDRRYASFLGLPAAPKGANEDAAVAAAAHDVLLASLPDQAARIDTAYASALAKIGDGEGKRAGIAGGQAAAKLAMAAGGPDPARPPQMYRPFTEPGVWVPTALPVFPTYLLSYRPWFLPRIDSVRPPPPPALTSAVYIRGLQETQRLGAKDSQARTAEQTQSAKFWVADDEAALLKQVADRPGRSLVQNARFYAMMNLAEDDSGTAIVDAKMHYGFWRPITAIRNGGRDPSALTVRDAAWEPLLRTPNHPEYPCGHCIHAAVVAAVLLAEDGVKPEDRFTFTADEMPGMALKLTLPESVTACSMSRIYGGVHYRFSNDVAEAMGAKVAALALARFAPLLK